MLRLEEFMAAGKTSAVMLLNGGSRGACAAFHEAERKRRYCDLQL